MTKKVIIIDDSITQLNILKSAFNKAGFDVWGYQNAKNAWEAIFDVAPDLIITDAIMPQMGGFQLIKAIRENEKISKIPLIVYSILNDSTAKYYLKEKMCEYFLRKNENTPELIELAQKIIKNHPVSQSYKSEIIKFKTDKENSNNEELTQEFLCEDTSEVNIEEDIDREALAKKIKENYDFSFCDEKLISNTFAILYPILNYDLSVISLYSFNRNETIAFFDIKGILISPIFQKKILSKFQAQSSVSYKKYAPDLKMVVSEDEFLSKIEFVFENKDNTKIYCVFYSKEKFRWQNQNNVEMIKNLLNDFFRARFINKNANANQKDGIAKKYLINKTNFSVNNKFMAENSQDCYFVIIHINNFSDLQNNLNLEETDVLNSKIVHKIMSCLDKNEQVYKNDEDEYNALIFAHDEKKLLYKLNCIKNVVEITVLNNQKPDIIISATNCNADGNFNIYEAQNRAKNALETNVKEEKVIIQ